MPIEHMYRPEQLNSMVNSRGCFGAIFHENQVWVFGGINYSERIMDKCETYSLAEDQWHQIAPMKQ